MKVIIAGSRSINDDNLLEQTIAKSGFVITEVVCGMAIGADALGWNWAKLNNIPVKEMPANWKRYGKRAGPIRNKEMGVYADAAIVLWDGTSPGSKNMISVMKQLKKPCYVQNNIMTNTLDDFTMEHDDD